MRASEAALRRTLAVAFAVMSIVLALRLFVPAAALTFSRRAAEEFNATGLPPWTRLALALPEMLGAVLFAVPRTFYIGALVLLLDLAGAVVAHLSLGVQPLGLYLLLAAVTSLALLHRYLLTCRLRQ
jgi:hypothetical protein